MIKKVNWQAFSNHDRTSLIEEIKSTISANGGAIINFNMFSDLALNLSIEIEARDLIKLHSALSKILRISELDSSEIRMESKKEYYLFLNISFTKGKGNLKNLIPEVPG